MTIEVGDKAPDFTMPASTGEKLSLADYRGKKVLLAFYVFDFTGG